MRASDIERINKAGKIAAFLDLEGGFDLDGDLGVLRDLHRLGLRWRRPRLAMPRKTDPQKAAKQWRIAEAVLAEFIAGKSP